VVLLPSCANVLLSGFVVKDFPVELSRQIPDEVRENFVTIVIPQWTALQKCADGWGRDDVAISESRVSASLEPDGKLSFRVVLTVKGFD